MSEGRKKVAPDPSSVRKSVAYFEHKRYRAAIANAKKQYYANAIIDYGISILT